ncbi:MAG: hypothetical protein ACRD36_07350 [Candidatus Acidiferrum sp.]
MRKIIVGVDMRRMFLQFLLARAFPAGRFGDAIRLLVLRSRNRRAKHGAAQKQGN